MPYASRFEYRPADPAMFDGGALAAVGDYPEKGGKGVTALADLAAGVTVLHYGGSMLSSDRYDADLDRPYGFATDGGCLDPASRVPGEGDVLQGAYAASVAARVNEPAPRRRPNCEFVRIGVEGVPFRVPVLVTLRAIRAGEELTAKYGSMYVRSWLAK